MITLYQVEWCPYCHRVREALTELGLDYEIVNVPAGRSDRTEVAEVSGQRAVPVIKDGDRVVADSRRIVDYLNDTYGGTADPEDRARHEESGRFRTVKQVADPPQDALRRLKEALAAEGVEVLAEAGGDRLGEGLPRDYTLLHLIVPEVAARAVAADPTVPAAVTVAAAVFASDGGSTVVVTTAEVGPWLAGDVNLLRLAPTVNRRIQETLARL